mgnify:FL=1
MLIPWPTNINWHWSQNHRLWLLWNFVDDILLQLCWKSYSRIAAPVPYIHGMLQRLTLTHTADPLFQFPNCIIKVSRETKHKNVNCWLRHISNKNEGMANIVFCTDDINIKYSPIHESKYAAGDSWPPPPEDILEAGA